MRHDLHAALCLQTSSLDLHKPYTHTHAVTASLYVRNADTFWHYLCYFVGRECLPTMSPLAANYVKVLEVRPTKIWHTESSFWQFILIMMISSITEKQCMLEVKVSDQHCMDISVKAELLLADVSCWSSLSLSADIVGLCGMVQEMWQRNEARRADKIHTCNDTHRQQWQYATHLASSCCCCCYIAQSISMVYYTLTTD